MHVGLPFLFHFFTPVATSSFPYSLSPFLPHSLTHSLPPSLTHSLSFFLCFFLPLSPFPLFFLTLIKREYCYNSCLSSFKLHTVIFLKDSMPFTFTKDSHIHSIVNYSRHCLPSQFQCGFYCPSSCLLACAPNYALRLLLKSLFVCLCLLLASINIFVSLTFCSQQIRLNHVWLFLLKIYFAQLVWPG